MVQSQPRLPALGASAALYARFSSSAQKLASIEIQLRLARRYASENHFVVFKEYSEIAQSGKGVRRRSVFQQLKKDAFEGRFQHLIIYNVSRFSRTWRQAMREFDDLKGKVTFHTVQGVLDEDRLLEEARRAEKDHHALMQNMREGRKYAADQGRVPHRPVFGFMKTGIPGAHEKHPVHSKTVERLFELLDVGLDGTGLGSTAVARILTKEGRPTPADAMSGKEGSTWSGASVLDVSRNPKYIGDVHYALTLALRDDDYELVGSVATAIDDRAGAHNPSMVIVDRDRYDRVQTRFFSNYPGVRRTPRTNPLSRLVDCGHCGEALSIGKNAFDQAVYRCNTILEKDTGVRCPGIGTHLVTQVDRIVIEELRSILEGDGRLEQFRQNHSERLERLTRIEDDQLRTLEDTLERCRLDTVGNGLEELRNGRLLDGDPLKRSESATVLMRKAVFEAEKRAEQALTDFERTACDHDLAEDLDCIDAAFRQLGAVLKGVAEKLDGDRFKCALRRILESVTITRIEKNVFEMRMATRIPQQVGGDSDWSELSVVVPYPMVKIKAAVATERRETERLRLDGMARGRTLAIPDQAFKLAAACAEAAGFNPKGLDLRTIVDAMVFYKKAQIPWRDLPAVLGDKALLNLAYHRLIRCHAWDATLSAWEAHCPELFHPLGREAFRFPGAIRSPAGYKRNESVTPLSIGELIAELSKTEDPQVRLRLQGLILLAEGWKVGKAAKKLGVQRHTVTRWRRKYEGRRAEDIASKTGKHNLLSPRQLATLIDFVRQRKSEVGRKQITLQEIFDHCTNVLKAPFKNKKSMSSTLYRQGIFLRKTT